MAVSFRKILDFIVSAKELISLLVGPLAGMWAYWQGMMEGLPIIVQFIAALAIFAFTSFGIASLLVILDSVLNEYGDKKEKNIAADHLQEMLDVHHECLPIGFIAEIWAGDNAKKDYIYNPKLRKIKNAVKEGQIEKCEKSDDITQTVTTAAFSRMMTTHGFEFGAVNMKTPVKVASVITALRKGVL